MKHSDFVIGLEFLAYAGFVWRCTDIGTRTITAIHIDGRNALWYKGPPYPVEEVVFDEHDLPHCHRNEDEAIKDAIHEADTSGHPGYPSSDMFRQMHVEQAESKYPSSRQGLLRYDRIREDGELLHPYTAWQSGDMWIIRLYLPFLQQYAEIPEIEFLGLPIATKADVKLRSGNSTEL